VEAQGPGAGTASWHLLVVPQELEQFRDQLGDAEGRRDNLMVIAEGGGLDDLENFRQRLRKADDVATQLRRDFERLEALRPTQLEMPDDTWIQKRLQELGATLASDEANTARLLRELIGSVRVFRVVPIGKKLGYPQLRFHSSAQLISMNHQNSVWTWAGLTNWIS
jgi:hypothetical protein